MIKLIAFGDLFGRKGRELVAAFLPELRERYRPDVLIANTENLTQGRGPIPTHLQELVDLGFDAFTSGNHVFDNLDQIRPYFETDDCRQIRPYNYDVHPDYPIPGKGWRIVEKPTGRLLVVSLLGRVFMPEPVENPFLAMDRLLAEFSGERFDGVVVDFHREATAEMALMAEYLRGRVGLLYGTHTHIQTNDDHVSGGLGMITDVGMSGALDSAIGGNYEAWLPGAIIGTRVHNQKQSVSMAPGVLCGIYAELEDNRCLRLEKIRLTESGAA